jgi:cytochrome c
VRPLAALLLLLAGCSAPEPADRDASSAAPAAAPIALTAAMGEAVFRRCTACHTIDKGGRNGVGPNLHGLVGRAVAAAPNFGYSPAMRAKGGVWDEATLDAYLKAPAQVVPGGRMAFAGIAEDAERKALILYLAEQK